MKKAVFVLILGIFPSTVSSISLTQETKSIQLLKPQMGSGNCLEPFLPAVEQRARALVACQGACEYPEKDIGIQKIKKPLLVLRFR